MDNELSLSSIFQKAFLVMKVGNKPVKMQKKSITLQQMDAKIRIWCPIDQISSIEKSESFKYSLSILRKQIGAKFYIDSIKYVIVRQLWWIFDFSQSAKKEEQSIQSQIKRLSYTLKQDYFRISNIVLQRKMYMSELLILVICKLTSRFFISCFTQINSGKEFEAQVYIMLNKLFVGIQVGPNAYRLHLQHFQKLSKKGSMSYSFRKTDEQKSENKQNQKVQQLMRQVRKTQKFGTFTASRQNTIKKTTEASVRIRQDKQQKQSKIALADQPRFVRGKNSRLSKVSSRGFLLERSKRKNMGHVYKSVEDQQQLLFKQQLKKTLQVPPLPQAAQKKYSLGQLSAKYLQEEKEKYSRSRTFLSMQKQMSQIGFLIGKNPAIYQQQNKKKSFSLQKHSQTMSHELLKTNIQISNTKQRKVSFKPQSYSTHYQLLKGIFNAQCPQKVKCKQSKLLKSSISTKKNLFKFGSSNQLKSGKTTPENDQEKRQPLIEFSKRESVSRGRSRSKVDYWVNKINKLRKGSVECRTDPKDLISVYQKKMTEKWTLGYQMMRRLEQLKQNEHRIQIQRLSKISKRNIETFTGSCKQEEQRQFLVNLISIAPQKAAQLEQEQDYILKNQNMKDLNSRQLKYQKCQFQKLCQKKDQMQNHYKYLISKIKGAKSKMLAISN